jgi:hypothetical protein
MPTYREMIFSIRKSLKQTFDDSALNNAHIAYVIDVVANRITALHIRKETTGQNLVIFENVKVVPGTFGKKFILPEKVFDLKNDAGIDFVAYPFLEDDCPAEIILFNRTNISSSHRLFMDKYEKPSEKNPYFARENNNVHLLGLECVNVEYVIAGLYTQLSYSGKCNIDAEVSVSPEHSYLVEIGALELLKFGTMVTGDKLNDGTDLSSLKNKLQSPVSKVANNDSE